MIKNLDELDLNYTEPVFCKNCYTTLNDFIDSGFVGCEDCYKYFADEVTKYINSTQFSNHHIGKRYFKNNNDALTINDYERMLRQAITEQRFEDCMVLKNKIQALKENLK